MKAHLPFKTFGLRLVRALLFLYAIAVITISLAGAVLFPVYAQANPEHFFPGNGWTTAQVHTALDQLGWPVTAPAYVEMVRWSLMLLVGAILGLLLLWRKSDSLFSLYLAFVFINLIAGDPFFTPVQEKVPALHLYTDFMSGAGWQFYFIVLYLFPDGKPVPGWTRWAVAGWLAYLGVYAIVGNVFFLPYKNIVNPAFSVLALSALASQVYRYFRRSGPIQRQQTRWVLAVMVLLICFLVFAMLWGFQSPSGENLGASLVLAEATLVIFMLLIVLFPIAITFAIFRYRLWDIDLVIRRTLLYAALTALLGLVYFGLVTLLQTLFVGASGQQSTLALVVSTLAIAAMFNPLRRRIQQTIDRRFFRQKYDTGQALEEFSSASRREVELTKLTDNLASVVQKTMQPELVSVWLRNVRHKPTEVK
jgi:hypothetical protein